MIKGTTGRIDVHFHRHRHGARLFSPRHPSFRSPASASSRSGSGLRQLPALVLGNLRRIGGMTWTIPLSANSSSTAFFGLTLFLVQVGMASGSKFATTVADTGFVMLAMGEPFVLLALAAADTWFIGLLVFRMAFPSTRWPASWLGDLRRPGGPGLREQADADGSSPDIGYAMISSGNDDREDPVRRYCPGAVLNLSAAAAS